MNPLAPSTKFMVFAGIVIAAIFICLISFWLLTAALVVAVLTLIILSRKYVQVRSFAGYLGLQIGHDNNYRLVALATLSFLSFIFAFKYGAGEPLFLSSWRETSEIIQSSEMYGENKDDIQSFKNRLARGLDKTDQQLDREKQYIKSVKNQLGQVLIPKEKGSNETPEVYNQKIRNHLVYGVFVDDLMMNIWLKNIPANFKVAPETEGARRTWIFWKLGFMFLFLFILYLPFALSDEAVDLLEKLKEYVKRKKDEYTIKVAPQPTLAPATVAPTPGIASITQRAGWFAKLYTSDMAAEFSIKLIEGLIKLLSRR